LSNTFISLPTAPQRCGKVAACFPEGLLPSEAPVCESWVMSSPALAKDTSSPDVLVRALDEAHVVGIWGTTLIQIWRGAPTSPLTAEINRIASAFVASSREPVSSLFIVERGSPPPDDESRKNIAAFSRDLVSRMSISVVVAEGGGFRSALVRAVGVTLTTILPHSSKFRFVNDAESAARLLEPHLGSRSRGAGGLLAAVAELRARLGAPGSK
jgi:hypothetical protein